MIQTGTVRLPLEAGEESFAGWGLDLSSGLRSYASPDIPFVPAFPDPPIMVAAVTGINIIQGPPQIDIELENIQAEEFNIRVRTGDETQLADVVVTWIAYSYGT